MKAKSLKIVIAFLAILLVAALSLGITGAFYTDRRQANGTLKFDSGVTIKYSGLYDSSNVLPNSSDENYPPVWTPANATSLRLFEMTSDGNTYKSVLPGETIPFGNVKLSKDTGDVYVKIKLVYTCYDESDNEIVPTTPSQVYTPSGSIKAPTSNAEGWVMNSDSTDTNNYGWYFLVNNSTDNTLKVLSATESALFSSAGIKMAELSYPGATGSHAPAAASGGYRVNGTKNNVSGTYTVTKVTVDLLVDVIQADAVSNTAVLSFKASNLK